MSVCRTLGIDRIDFTSVSLWSSFHLVSRNGTHCGPRGFVYRARRVTGALFSPLPLLLPVLLFFIFSLISSAHLRFRARHFSTMTIRIAGGIRAVVLGEANRRVGRNRKERSRRGRAEGLRCNSGHKARLMRRSALW